MYASTCDEIILDFSFPILLMLYYDNSYFIIYPLKTQFWGASMAQSVKLLTLNFSVGLNLRVMRLSPALGSPS